MTSGVEMLQSNVKNSRQNGFGIKRTVKQPHEVTEDLGLGHEAPPYETV